MAEPKLKRDLNLLSISLYGLGNILGAGIYALIGIVAAKAGTFVPVSFLLALVLAIFTALSYMEFSSRYPLASGEAIYIHKAFSKQFLSVLIGLMIAFAGLVSAATMMRSFVGYFNVFLDAPANLLIIVLVILIGAIAIWGISESALLASVITLIEVSGLLLVVWVSKSAFLELPAKLPSLIPPADADIWQGIVLGTFIAFYAFIGFEDMVTVAEEVKDPEKTMPRAIFFAVVAATVVYLAISVTAVLVAEPSLLATSDAPMALIYEMSTGSAPVVITCISMFAVLNGALIQIIKASRMMYGMSKEKWLPEIFARVNSVTRTPVIATVLVTVIILVLALSFPLASLATATSFTVLTVFALINLALLKIKLEEKGKKTTKTAISFPAIIPFLGFVFSSAIVVFKIFNL